VVGPGVGEQAHLAPEISLVVEHNCSLPSVFGAKVERGRRHDQAQTYRGPPYPRNLWERPLVVRRKDETVTLKANIDIRPAGVQDAAGIADVAQRTWNDTYAEIILPTTQERLLGRWYTPAALGEATGQSDSWFYVAVVEEKVIGFAQFVMREDRRGELTRIYVLPEWQRQGVGGRLLGEGLASLLSHGAQEVFVHVERGNNKGIGFYESRGFHGVREFVVELPDQDLDLVEYTLSLESR